MLNSNGQISGVPITQAGLESLKRELDELVDIKRPKLVERLAFARTQGDLTENTEYHNAKDELEFLDGRISELQEVLRFAVVADKGGHKGAISLGTQVKLKANGKEHIFYIVGEWEADPAEKKISHTSPLGQALIGKKVGERVEVEAPAGKITYEILAIE